MPSEYELMQMQCLPLEIKIKKTKQRIREFYEHFNGDVYVSFSGGKDSTVLLDIVRQVYPVVEAVFVDTGLEYPEIRQFVKGYENVTWLKPEMNFKEVIKKYGYPLPTKEYARDIYYAKRGSEWAMDKFSQRSEERFIIPKRWEKLASKECPFEVSDFCCGIMKKKPFHNYQKQTKKHSIIGTLAVESARRKNSWCKHGCNAFDSKEPKSQPIAFWTEHDILLYIKRYKLPICSVYGEVTDDYKLTGCQRTGCMFCLFGIGSEKEPNRIQRMKFTYPKQYEYILRDIEDGGLGYKKVLEYCDIPYEWDGVIK